MIEHSLNHPIGFAHLVLAVAAIAFGTAIIFTRKGTGKHRWLGRAYVVMMLAVNATALAI